MNRWYRIVSFAVIVALVGVFALPASAQGGGLVDIPVTGTLPGGTFTGLLTITEFAVNQAGDLLVSGVLTGTAVVGGVPTAINQTFTAVLADLIGPAQGKCDILFLDIGPIFLDLLGLQVDLSQITLDIDAVPGPGNLLGNLLCAVAGLLDNGGPLNGILALLDRINRLL
jgi:hypothetical protein